MDIKATLHGVALYFESLLGALPPENQAAAIDAVGKIRSVAESVVETAVDGAVTLAAPSLAPELIPIINEALDAFAARLQADADARIAAITNAKAAIAPAA